MVFFDSFWFLLAICVFRGRIDSPLPRIIIEWIRFWLFANQVPQRHARSWTNSRSYNRNGTLRSVSAVRTSGRLRFCPCRRKVHRAGVSWGNLSRGRRNRFRSQRTFSTRLCGRDSIYIPSTQWSETRNFSNSRRPADIWWTGRRFGRCLKYNCPWRWKFCSCTIANTLF